MEKMINEINDHLRRNPDLRMSWIQVLTPLYAVVWFDKGDTKDYETVTFGLVVFDGKEQIFKRFDFCEKRPE